MHYVTAASSHSLTTGPDGPYVQLWQSKDISESFSTQSTLRFHDRHQRVSPGAPARLPRMDEQNTPKRHLGAIVGPPSIETWSQLCREASDKELPRLRLLALDCLCVDGGESQRWLTYISMVEETLRQRGIKLD